VSYNDENFALRRMFVYNIPMLRNAEKGIIDKCVTLLRSEFYPKDEIVLRSKIRENDKIFILLKGEIQVRVHYINLATKERVDYWICTLRQGGCFNVYSPFSSKRSSIVYFVTTEDCLIEYLSLAELKEASLNMIKLHDILTETREKVKKNKVDDLDFFTFPQKFLDWN
jgi:hypothetical protein